MCSSHNVKTLIWNYWISHENHPILFHLSPNWEHGGIQLVKIHSFSTHAAKVFKSGSNSRWAPFTTNGSFYWGETTNISQLTGSHQHPLHIIHMLISANCAGTFLQALIILMYSVPSLKLSLTEVPIIVQNKSPRLLQMKKIIIGCRYEHGSES